MLLKPAQKMKSSAMRIATTRIFTSGCLSMDKMADDCEIKISEDAKFLDMLIIPVDMDDYLDIVRRL